MSLLMIYEINHIWTAEMKWKWRNDRERNLCNCVRKPEKNSGFQRGLNPWPRNLPVRCSTNWAMKPRTVGAGQLWVHMFPWKKWVLMIYEINHIRTTEMKWKWRNDRSSERNLCNCVRKPEKKFRTSTGFEPVTSRFTGAMLYQLSYEAMSLAL